MSTIWAEMLTGVYASPMAVDATLQPGAGGDPISLRAMDKTSGVVFGGDNDPDIQTIYPVATVLMSALDEAGVSHEDLDGERSPLTESSGTSKHTGSSHRRMGN